MSPGRDDTAVMLIARDVRRFFAIDRQSNHQVAPEIWRALHNHPANLSARDRTRRRPRLTEKSRESLCVVTRNNKDRTSRHRPNEGLRKKVHCSKFIPLSARFLLST